MPEHNPMKIIPQVTAIADSNRDGNKEAKLTDRSFNEWIIKSLIQQNCWKCWFIQKWSMWLFKWLFESFTWSVHSKVQITSSTKYHCVLFKDVWCSAVLMCAIIFMAIIKWQQATLPTFCLKYKSLIIIKVLLKILIYEYFMKLYKLYIDCKPIIRFAVLLIFGKTTLLSCIFRALYSFWWHFCSKPLLFPTLGSYIFLSKDQFVHVRKILVLN